jgi:hypothetical protein
MSEDNNDQLSPTSSSEMLQEDKTITVNNGFSIQNTSYRGLPSCRRQKETNNKSHVCDVCGKSFCSVAACANTF